MIQIDNEEYILNHGKKLATSTGYQQEPQLPSRHRLPSLFARGRHSSIKSILGEARSEETGVFSPLVVYLRRPDT